MKKILYVLLCVIFTSITLTACGGADANTSAVMATTAAAGVYKTEAAAETYSFTEETLDMEYSTSDSGALSGTNGLNSIADLGRKLIRTIHLDVETDEFEVLLDTLQQEIVSLNGYVEQSDISGNSIQNTRSRRHAYMTVRIPSTKLDSFVSSVEEQGNVTNKSETTTDVTLQYSDLESRKKSLSIEQDRIWELLEKADTLESVIALEERLSEIRYELESMESKLRLYDNQVEYSTVYVNIQEVKIYTPTAPETVGERIQKGFTSNVENLKETAIDLFVWFISSLPILVPFIAIILLLVLIIKRLTSKNKIKNIASNVITDLQSSDEDIHK